MRGKDLIAFGIFLLISASFWFVSTLNDTYEMEMKVPLQLSEVPENIVISEPLPDSVVFTVKDKGFILLDHLYEERDKPIRLSFRVYKGRTARVRCRPTRCRSFSLCASLPPHASCR